MPSFRKRLDTGYRPSAIWRLRSRPQAMLVFNTIAFCCLHVDINLLPILPFISPFCANLRANNITDKFAQ
ncbi:hypothetical protein [Kluyvera cryocrescens]|uniref:hypothetical protein n=1 Tax=Kluyvera cryocrescens TaxID=580 RepID=UPI002DBDCC30|nr:hypothetical protein [Kluyvera cryocrescens]MEB6632124.1 hypothetical protein [Kluyvera cryocrescens]